jgi:hypothetical protein
MAQIQNATPPRWLGRRRLSLLGDVIGGWRQNREKLAQLAGLLVTFFRPGVVRARVRRLKDLGHCDEVPTVSQMLVASIDQLTFSLGGDTKEFYRSQGIPWVFHNVRRLIAYPTSMMDPLGFLSPRDTIIHHVLQTFHRHPLYDVILLRAYDRGMEEMVAQAEQVARGTHPHQRSLDSLIEDGSYHERLARQVREMAADPHMKPLPIPEGLVQDPHLMLAMDQFKDLRGFTYYASRIEAGPATVLKAIAWMALYEVFGIRVGRKTLRVENCFPELVTKHLGGRPG